MTERLYVCARCGGPVNVQLSLIHPQKRDAIQVVFEYWQKKLHHPRARLTPDRRKKIANRLKEGYSVADCRAAIDGCSASAYHMGDNSSQTRYDSIGLIFRNGETLERFQSYRRRARHARRGPSLEEYLAKP